MIRPEELQKTEPFAGLTESDCEVLAARAEEIVTDSSTSILEEGDEATALYILLGGRVEVTKAGPRGAPQVLAVLEAGSLFGELSLYDPGVRSASVKTRGAARLARFPYEEIGAIAEADPSLGYRLLRGILRVVAARLRAAGDSIRDRLVWQLGPVVR